MITPRLQKFYLQIVCEDFLILYNFTNVSALPKFERVILTSTSNRFTTSKTSVAQSFCANYLQTSQKCISTRARKSVDLFKIRKSNLLGLKFTLRNKNLFSFLDKFSIFVLPKLFSKNQKVQTQVNFLKAIKNDIFGETKDIIVNNKTLFLEKQSFRIKLKPAIINRKEIVGQQQKYLNVFTISNKSSFSFFEVSQLSIFFDSLPGFALSFYFAVPKGDVSSVKKNSLTSFSAVSFKAGNQNDNLLEKNIDLYRVEKTDYSKIKNYTSIHNLAYNLQESNFRSDLIAREYKIKKQLLSAVGFPWFVR